MKSERKDKCPQSHSHLTSLDAKHSSLGIIGNPTNSVCLFCFTNTTIGGLVAFGGYAMHEHRNGSLSVLTANISHTIISMQRETNFIQRYALVVNIFSVQRSRHTG